MSPQKTRILPDALADLTEFQEFWGAAVSKISSAS
jgi:hypothetical protein